MTYPAPHPKYGAPLSGRPLTIDGVTFRPYRCGILMYVRVSDDFRIEVSRAYKGETWRASFDGISLPVKFRHEKNAYRAGVAAVRKADASLQLQKQEDSNA